MRKNISRSLTRIMSNKNAHALFGVTSIVGILSGAQGQIFFYLLVLGTFRVKHWVGEGNKNEIKMRKMLVGKKKRVCCASYFYFFKVIKRRYTVYTLFK